ncbi:hypothetical protein BH09SUM1_BH09SUM1_32500 [soil metagenome]
MPRAFGFVETKGFVGGVEATDAMNKAAAVEFVRRIDINGGYVTTLVTGDVGAVRAAVDAGVAAARRVGEVSSGHVIPALHEQAVARVLRDEMLKELPAGMNALGMIETIGYVPMIDAADAAVKAATVEIVNKLWIGAGYAIILLRGDVAAIKAAVDAGTAAAGRLGKVVSSHVIPSPHRSLSKPLPIGPPMHGANQKPPKDDDGDSGDALGFIETKGFTSLIAGSDAAVKAARVRCLGYQKVGSALVTTVFKGDIAAVKASVDAGAAEARRVGELISVHVIPRPHEAAIGYSFPNGIS